MSKHFSVEEGNLYLFTTGAELLPDLNMFPDELDLFNAEATWRISPWVAVAEDVLLGVMERAQIILQLNGFQRSFVPAKELESYFIDGEEQRIIQTIEPHRVEVTPKTFPVIGRRDD